MSNRNRGNAAPETALALSFTLLVLFGIVQIATTAFYQISADGATFVGAHDTVANIGNPTSANKSDASTAANGVFSKIVTGSINALNPSNSTFETDVAQQVPGITALGNPMALTINSRLIEESGGTASSSQLPPSVLDCTTSAENIVDKGNGYAAGKVAPPITKVIGLTQASGIVAQTGGSGALSLDPTPVVNELTVLNGAETQISNTVAALKLLPTTLTGAVTTTLSTLGLGSLVNPVVNSIASGVSTAVAQALSGTLTAAQEAQDLVGINTAIGQVPGLGSVAAALLVPVVDAVLTGGTGGKGILGQNGALNALNVAETAVNTALNTNVKACNQVGQS